jgi:hypothetical protein
LKTEVYVQELKHGREDIKSASLIILFFSILDREASKSDLSKVAKKVSSIHLIVAALGFCIIKASSPNDLPASKVATSLNFLLMLELLLYDISPNS